MAQQHIGQIGEFLPGLFQQCVAIRHCGKPAAVEISLYAFPIDGLAVAHMVLGHHNIAKGIHIVCKGIITLYILCNAVDDLQHCNRGLLRHPSTDMDLTGALGCIKFICSHGTHSTTV